MKWSSGTAIWVLATTLAFSQQPVKGANSSSASSAAPGGAADQGSFGNMQVKSTGQILEENPQLVEKMKTLLPADMTPEQACSGYKVFEQCLSAIHLSKDLSLSFAALKAETTGKHSSGLESAVKHLTPSSDAKDAVKAARKEAAAEMKGISLFG